MSRRKNSFPVPRCQRQTTTRSCSGSIQIVLEPNPSAAKLVLGVGPVLSLAIQPPKVSVIDIAGAAVGGGGFDPGLGDHLSVLPFAPPEHQVAEAGMVACVDPQA